MTLNINNQYKTENIDIREDAKLININNSTVVNLGICCDFDYITITEAPNLRKLVIKHKDSNFNLYKKPKLILNNYFDRLVFLIIEGLTFTDKIRLNLLFPNLAILKLMNCTIDKGFDFYKSMNYLKGFSLINCKGIELFNFDQYLPNLELCCIKNTACKVVYSIKLPSVKNYHLKLRKSQLPVKMLCLVINEVFEFFPNLVEFKYNNKVYDRSYNDKNSFIYNKTDLVEYRESIMGNYRIINDKILTIEKLIKRTDDENIINTYKDQIEMLKETFSSINKKDRLVSVNYNDLDFDTRSVFSIKNNKVLFK